jgi:uncharacterized protein (DUF3820 family)
MSNFTYWPPEEAHIIDEWFERQPELGPVSDDSTQESYLERWHRRRIWFGKHKGKRLDQLPYDYLEWMCTAKLHPKHNQMAVTYLIMIDRPEKQLTPTGKANQAFNEATS